MTQLIAALVIKKVFWHFLWSFIRSSVGIDQDQDHGHGQQRKEKRRKRNGVEVG